MWRNVVIASAHTRRLSSESEWHPAETLLKRKSKGMLVQSSLEGRKAFTTLVGRFVKAGRHALVVKARGVVRKLAQYLSFLSLDGFQNRKMASSASKLELPQIILDGNSTSFSDYKEYRQIVAGAAADEKVFNLFRSHHQYFPILEHVSKDHGRSYLEIARKRSNLPGDWAQRCDPLNNIGGPPKYRYPSIGRFSPTVLRYVKVFSDLDLLFGPLKGQRCIEIGIGFGGQATVLDLLGEVEELQLYDLPPVLSLAEKFLSRAGVSATTSYLDGSNPPLARRADLLISNYAFSELTRSIQLTYLEKVARQTSRGYITWNSVSQDGLGPEELLSLIPGSRLLEEEPKTHPDNVIIVWGTSVSL